MLFTRWGKKNGTPQFQRRMDDKHDHYEKPDGGNGSMNSAEEFCKFDHNEEGVGGIPHRDARFIEISRNLAPYFIKIARLAVKLDVVQGLEHSVANLKKYNDERHECLAGLNDAIEMERIRYEQATQ